MSEFRALLRKWEPAVPKGWLVLLSGLMWSAVGIMLCWLAYGWLAPEPVSHGVPLGLAGIAAALAIYQFGFSRLADKNIRRIENYDREKVCVFAFQEWKSYVIIVIMMALGITLRRSGFPKPYLAVLYTGIGGGLLLSSLRYYINLFNQPATNEGG
jgi:hypothetical protein